MNVAAPINAPNNSPTTEKLARLASARKLSPALSWTVEAGSLGHPKADWSTVEYTAPTDPTQFQPA